MSLNLTTEESRDVASGGGGLNPRLALTVLITVLLQSRLETGRRSPEGAVSVKGELDCAGEEMRETTERMVSDDINVTPCQVFFLHFS